MLRWVFVAPSARDFYVHWDAITDIAVCEFREVAGTDLGDPRLCALIDELWARADVGCRTGPLDFRHPKLGELHLHRTRLRVPHSNGQHLLIYHAEPGSESAQALEALRAGPKGLEPPTF